MKPFVVRCTYFDELYIADCEGRKFFFDAAIVHRYRFVEPLVYSNVAGVPLEVRLKMWNEKGKPVMLRDRRIKRVIGAELLGKI